MVREEMEKGTTLVVVGFCGTDGKRLRPNTLQQTDERRAWVLASLNV